MGIPEGWVPGYPKRSLWCWRMRKSTPKNRFQSPEGKNGGKYVSPKIEGVPSPGRNMIKPWDCYGAPMFSIYIDQASWFLMQSAVFSFVLFSLFGNLSFLIYSWSVITANTFTLTAYSWLCCEYSPNPDVLVFSSLFINNKNNVCDLKTVWARVLNDGMTAWAINESTMVRPTGIVK